MVSSASTMIITYYAEAINEKSIIYVQYFENVWTLIILYLCILKLPVSM